MRAENARDVDTNQVNNNQVNQPVLFLIIYYMPFIITNIYEQYCEMMISMQLKFPLAAAVFNQICS